jgi:nanoRNase/pAp phosphatase (c-di-AMP/oligoRNAs hydrolase)
MQKILSRIKKEGDIIYSRYSNDELVEAGLHPDSADYALYLMVDIKEAHLIILGKEQGDGYIKMSLRGKGKYNCRDITSQF